jgi:hypothetical protein
LSATTFELVWVKCFAVHSSAVVEFQDFIILPAAAFLAAGAGLAGPAVMKDKKRCHQKNNHWSNGFLRACLCQPEALLSMVLLAELLEVLVLVLSEPYAAWLRLGARLALTSLFVRWIVLLSARVPLAPGYGTHAGSGRAMRMIVVALSLTCTAVAD